jgi:hypothetical protein
LFNDIRHGRDITDKSTDYSIIKIQNIANIALAKICKTYYSDYNIHMTIKNGVKHVLESIIVKKTNLANRFADFLLRVLYQKNQLHVSADTRARLLDAILTPQDVSKQYEGNKAFYSLLKFYNARIVILERDSIDKKNEKEYNELKALQAALGKVRLYPDKVVLPSGYTVLKQALLVKDYYRENSLRRKNAQAPENYPELVSRMHSIHPEASIATIEQYEEMMSFFPENEYNKRDLLLRTLL